MPSSPSPPRLRSSGSGGVYTQTMAQEVIWLAHHSLLSPHTMKGRSERLASDFFAE